MVGENNAGKSTLVKAMLLMRDFLRSRIETVDKTENIFKTFSRPQFSFDAEHANVGDFYRAFCRQSSRKENTIVFTMKIDKFRFIVKISGERKPGIIPEVTMIAVSDEDRDITFTFDFLKNQMAARFSYDRKALNSHMIDKNDYLLMKEKELNDRLIELESKLSRYEDLEKITAIKVDIERTIRELDRIKSERKVVEQSNNGYSVEEYDSVTIDMSYFMGGNAGKLVIPELIKGFAYYSNITIYRDKRSKEYKEQEAKRSFLLGKVNEIFTISEEIENVINSLKIEYIYAHSVNHSSLYAECANSSDYTKKTIHEFYTARISKGDDEFSLIEEWLKEFKIGNSLKVLSNKGDNYSIAIFDDKNPEITNERGKDYPGGIDLADKGMGAIQMVILLLRLATLIRKYKGQQLTILLEEPEQNLHPALQSKLAELVYCVSKDFRVRFIIETHSEYLIRKSQVIVAETYKSKNNYIDNPFKVYYLPSDGSVPYEMVYRTDGKFSNEFGTGFFDEANNLLFDIL